MVLNVDTEKTTGIIDNVDRFCRVCMPGRDLAMACRIIAKMPMVSVGEVDYRALKNMKES